MAGGEYVVVSGDLIVCAHYQFHMVGEYLVLHLDDWTDGWSFVRALHGDDAEEPGYDDAGVHDIFNCTGRYSPDIVCRRTITKSVCGRLGTG